MKKEIFIIALSGLLFILPVLFLTRDLSFRLDTDYDMALPVLHFLVDFMRTNFSLPSWNPYIGTGIPVIGDPQSLVFYPFIIIPLFIFGADFGLRFAIIISILFSGISMWVLLSKLRTNRWTRIWGAIVYQLSGPLIAAISAGHVGKILSFPFFPLFLALVIDKKIKKINIVLSAVILTLIFFIGDFYALWFLVLIYVSIKTFYLIKEKKQLRQVITQTFFIFLLFFIFSSVKLISFLKDMNPSMERFFPVNHYAGSIHFFLSPLAFIMPLQVEFYDRPFFQRFLGFHFNWYEYYAFITPLPFIFLLKIKNVLKNEHVKFLIFYIILGVLYVSMKYYYSPFHWLYEFLTPIQSFRVPQRIFTPMTGILIALLAVCASYWLDKTKVKKEKIVICGIFLISIVWLFFIGQQTIYKTFEKPRTDEESIVRELRKKDKGNFYVASFTCCMQTFLIKEKIPVLNFYYGWRAKDLPNFINEKGNGYNYEKLKNIRPSYIITEKELDFKKYSYFKFIENSKIRIWKTDRPNIFPKRL